MEFEEPKSKCTWKVKGSKIPDILPEKNNQAWGCALNNITSL